MLVLSCWLEWLWWVYLCMFICLPWCAKACSQSNTSSLRGQHTHYKRADTSAPCLGAQLSLLCLTSVSIELQRDVMFVLMERSEVTEHGSHVSPISGNMPCLDALDGPWSRSSLCKDVFPKSFIDLVLVKLQVTFHPPFMLLHLPSRYIFPICVFWSRLMSSSSSDRCGNR